MPSKEQSRTALNGLIKRYNENKSDKSFVSNEKQIQQALIVPFVRDVLGWNVDEPSEFKVEAPAKGKKVDILVCLNGITQYIIEAKSLTQDLVDNTDFYRQAMSYANGKGKTFAILTNFRYFIILRCDVEVDNPLKAALPTIDIENLKDSDFDLLYNFSKKVWAETGEQNPLYSKLANYKRRAKVDARLLDNLKSWRQAIINNVKNHPRHNKLDFSNEKEKYEIEEEIQRFLDRLIFICYAEDKEFVDSELKPMLEQKKDKYFSSPSWLLSKIRELFQKFWKDYNSDLFRHGKCDEFFIEDGVLADILTDLRKPKKDLPYDFSSIEADILGKTYENFIGHVIAGEKRLKEKESKGKRKEMGIYYTPAYIVDYIVRNTVGEYVKGKPFAFINKVKILDPACGSGSFLIKAFDVLAEECEKTCERKLNYEEKKNLMLNCIFGVDKDERAVDICKLNLSLKLAERGQKLPELHENIKCGDSLIDDKEVAGYKAFKWEDEFKGIMADGGFDVVIGNPPYINNRNLLKKEKSFFETNYSTAYQQYDIYVLFYELALRILKHEGYLGFITPNKFAITNYGIPLRKMLLNQSIIKIVDVSQIDVFGDVSTYPYIVIIKKSKSVNNKFRVYNSISQNLENSLLEIKQSELNAEEPFLFGLNKKEIVILSKIKGEKLIHIYRAKPTSKNISVKGDGIVITNKNIEKYKLTISKERIQKKDEWLIKIPSILMKKICFVPTATLIELNKYVPINTVYVINSRIKELPLQYLLAIINSKLIGYYTRKKYSVTAMRGGFIELRTFEIEQIPITISEKYQEKLKKLADKMLSLNKKLQEDNLSQLEKQKLEQEIKKTDNEIDELVYQLYGITEEEKKIIEESLK